MCWAGLVTFSSFSWDCGLRRYRTLVVLSLIVIGFGRYKMVIVAGFLWTHLMVSVSLQVSLSWSFAGNHCMVGTFLLVLARAELPHCCWPFPPSLSTCSLLSGLELGGCGAGWSTKRGPGPGRRSTPPRRAGFHPLHTTGAWFASCPSSGLLSL